MNRRFVSFAEEKKYYMYNRAGAGWGDPWGGLEEIIDVDIKPFIFVINELPFAFSKGMSCSGSYLDHSGSRDPIIAESQNREGPVAFTLHKGGHNGRYGVRVGEPQGYAALRIDESNPLANALKNLLVKVPLSLLLLSRDGDRSDMTDKDVTPDANTYTYQVFLPPELRCPFPSDTTYMTRIWSGLADRITKLR